ncbi:Short-chain dehydrogenase/reductase family protein [Mycena sanguinolenta]|uniref:Short-chain dehydrogenase/reductase family protein n=1 Tax=Mycena sanguinolenta TaxID=230812 RepID=A0A8H7CS95_9AGAR|nr:Short-chain dehydrogenase/reductase family protein [Mycena sanguinolenta]
MRSILVTGSNQGLGYHAVHQLGATENVLVFMGSRKLAAAEEARAKFASDIHPSSLVVPVQLDVTDTTSIKNAEKFVADYLKDKNLPGLDVLMNNAGVVGATFEATYAVNVFGANAVKEAFRPLMNNGGAILNISSSLGSLQWHTQRPPPPIYPPYSSSKSALNSLTLQWAIQEEEKKSGIRVVSICPGHNATNLNNYTGRMDPADGAKVMVEAALAKEGKSGVFINKDGEVKW